jgi:RES domain-containing protein
VRVWRLVRKRRLSDAYTGEGARLAGGRWNTPGVRVIYTSQSLSLATLEYLVHAGFLHAPADVNAVPAEIPADLPKETIAIGQLPIYWRRYDPPVETLREMGDSWIKRNKTALLEVPSAIVPLESNYLLNPAHRDFARIKLGKVTAISFDPRFFP